MHTLHTHTYITELHTNKILWPFICVNYNDNNVDMNN